MGPHFSDIETSPPAGEAGLVQDEFPVDPLTGFLPGSVLVSEAGLRALQERLGDPERVVVRFRDQSGLSILGRFGFYGTADILLAMLKVTEETSGIVSVRVAGDELLDVTDADGARERIESYDELMEVVREGVFGTGLTPAHTIRERIAREVGWESRDAIRSADHKIMDLLEGQIVLAREFASLKAGCRMLRQEYISAVGNNPTVAGFREFLAAQCGGFNKTDVIPDRELLKRVLQERPEVCKAPPLGSFEGVMIEMEGPLTVESVRRALVQAEVLLHAVKKNPGDDRLRALLGEVHPLDTARELRTVDEDEIRASRDSGDRREALERALLDAGTDTDRNRLEHELRREVFSDPVLPGVLRCSRIEGDTLDTLLENTPTTVCKIDIPGFQVLNNALGYSRADAVLRRVAEAVREEFPGAVLGRVSGGTLCVFMGEDDAPFDRHLVANSLTRVVEATVAQLPQAVQAKMALEVIERGFLNAEALRLQEIHHALIEEKFAGCPIAIESLKEASVFVRPEEEFPKVTVSQPLSVNPSELRFGDLRDV